MGVSDTKIISEERVGRSPIRGCWLWRRNPEGTGRVKAWRGDTAQCKQSVVTKRRGSTDRTLWLLGWAGWYKGMGDGQASIYAL